MGLQPIAARYLSVNLTDLNPYVLKCTEIIDAAGALMKTFAKLFSFNSMANNLLRLPDGGGLN